VNGWFAAYLAAVARLFGGLPHAQVASWKALAGLAAVTALVVLFVRLPPPRGRRSALLAAVLALVLAGWQLRPDHTVPPPTGLRITFLDVGQGDGALIQVPLSPFAKKTSPGLWLSRPRLAAALPQAFPSQYRVRLTQVHPIWTTRPQTARWEPETEPN